MPIEILDLGDEHADYLHDESRREGWAEHMAYPECTDDVCEALRIAAAKNWSVTVQGGRTGITGGCVPEGGLILNLSRMNAIGDRDGDKVAVQPGVTLCDMREAIKGSGMFFPSDLTETTATIGGMVANNASGARSLKYGSVRCWIHALEVVLAHGEAVRVERGANQVRGFEFQLGSIKGTLPELPVPVVKSAAGYCIKPGMDLVDLFIGSEGTLGVITGITIRLLPETEVMTGLTAFFAAENTALDLVRFLRSAGDPVAIEFFDANALNLLRRMKAGNEAFSELPELNPAFHTAIYFEYEGEVPESVLEQVESLAIDCWVSEGDHEIEMLRNFRHAIPESVNLLIAERRKSIPSLTKLGTDMSVPDDRMEDMMRMYHESLGRVGLDYVIFGHIGNNHVHVNIMPRSMEEFDKGKSLYLDWARQVVEWGGSVSAEHGIGKNKTEFLELMFGERGVSGMRALKALFDPENRLNPGNLFKD